MSDPTVNTADYDGSPRGMGIQAKLKLLSYSPYRDLAMLCKSCSYILCLHDFYRPHTGIDLGVFIPDRTVSKTIHVCLGLSFCK